MRPTPEGTEERIENGTETFYLILTTDPAAVTALVGTDVDGDDDHVTDIATDPRHSIIDIIAMVGPDPADHVYDGARALGPDGIFFPVGIFRDPADPVDWCPSFLGWLPGTDQTPCAPNRDCDDLGTRVCQSNPNSTGYPARITGTGSDVAGTGEIVTLTATPVPSYPGIFFFGPNPIRVPFGPGFLCVGGGLTRLLPPVIGSGYVATRDVDNGAFRAGDVLYFQYWFRDPSLGPVFNTSDAICVTFR